MYLVSADQFHRTAKKKTQRRGPYEKWSKFREKMFHEETGGRMRVKAVADLLKQVLPHSTSSSITTQTESGQKKTTPRPPLPSTSAKTTAPHPAVVYKKPKGTSVRDDVDDEYEPDDDTEKVSRETWRIMAN
jgi:hypothetical protein